MSFFESLPREALLNARFGEETPLEVVRLAYLELFPGKTALVTSFGTESALLLDLVAQVDRAFPVLFIDTGKHFPETLAYRDQLIAHFKLEAVTIVKPYEVQINAADSDGTLWSRAPDYCCNLRKAIPLEDALAPYDCWIAGRKRHHGGLRSTLDIFEEQGGRIQVSPLARSSAEELDRIFEDRGLPRHPLYRKGYRSIGCANCTVKTPEGTDPRAGRWQGLGKTECGIHQQATTLSSAQVS